MPGDGITIVGWTKHSFIDFPGTVSTVLFFSGCNLSCPWCHNPGVVRGEYPSLHLPEVLAYLDKRRGMIEGVVCSGGEPTLHTGLPALVQEVRGHGLKIKIDTNGLLPDVVRQCAPDYLALDIKTIPSRYKEIGCACDDAERRLKRSIAKVKELGRNAEVRIPVAPGFIDHRAIAVLADLIAGVERVFLQPLKTDVPLLDPDFARLPTPSLQQIERFRDLLAGHVGSCRIRGHENG